MTDSILKDQPVAGEAVVGDFANIRRKAWHQKGLFASQTGYVTLALVVIVAIMWLGSRQFLTIGNLTNIAKDFSFIAIVTLGMTIVVIQGGIDLSVGSVMALSAIVCAMVMAAVAAPETALAPALVPILGPVLHAIGAIPLGGLVAAVLAALAAAAVVGFCNGFLIARIGLSPFVTTLGMLSIVRGLAFAITQGRGQTPRGHDVDLFYSLTDGTLGVLPSELIYLVVLGIALSLVLHQTAWGRHVFAIGGNEKAARLTGVPVDRIKITAYVLCSLSAGLSGILMVGWLGSAPANLATGYELTIIAAAVIGGANLAGGAGGPLGAVIGALLLEVIRNGLVLAGIDAYWQIVLVGFIIILAVLVDRLRTRKAA